MQLTDKLMRIFLITLALCLFSCSGIQTRYHEVGRGDTLSGIAQKYEVSEPELRDRNRTAIARGLKPGSKLYIPFESNPNWNGEYEMDGRSLATTVDDGTDNAPIAYKVASSHFTWPVRGGTVSSHFGRRRGKIHEGIDIAAKKGTPVRSARSGHVIYAGNQIGGYGNMVIIRHADSYSTVYAHLSKIGVKKGQFVARNQLLGRVGRTGHATGNHLHFEVRNKRVAVNPLLYLQTRVAVNTVGR